MPFQQELDEKFFAQLSPIALETSMAFIIVLSIFSFFYDREVIFKYLKYMISTFLLFIFSIVNVLVFTDDTKFQVNQKIFELKVEKTKELNSTIKTLYENEMTNHQETIQSLDKLKDLDDLLLSLMVITITFIWIHSLMHLVSLYDNLKDQVAIIVLFFSVFLLFKNIVNIFIILIMLSAVGFSFYRYFEKKLPKTNIKSKKSNFLKITIPK